MIIFDYGLVFVERHDTVEDIAAYTHMTVDELINKIQKIVDEDRGSHNANCS